MGEVPASLNLTIEPSSRYNELLSLDGKTIKFDDDENIYEISVSTSNKTIMIHTDILSDLKTNIVQRIERKLKHNTELPMFKRIMTLSKCNLHK